MALVLLAVSLAALVGGDLAGLIPLGGAAVAGLVAYRSGTERLGHSALTALFSRKNH